MSLSKHAGLHDPIKFSFTEAAAAEVSAAEENESLALTADGAESVNWTYSATAEDNGTAGDLDGEPGVIYRGEGTQAVRVSIRDLDLAEGTSPPEATDEVTIGVYKNSTLVAYADEGFVSELDTETAAEMNVDTVVDAVGENDVIRVGLIGDNGETIDIDVAAGGVVTIG